MDKLSFIYSEVDIGDEEDEQRRYAEQIRRIKNVAKLVRDTIIEDVEFDEIGEDFNRASALI